MSGGYEDTTLSVDKSNSQHDGDVIKEFYSNYQNYDPFSHEKNMSSIISTADKTGQQRDKLKYKSGNR